MVLWLLIYRIRWSQWPRGLRRRSAAARLLRSWVRIPPGAWIFVCCECCVLSGRGLCDELITRPEEYYRLWCVVVRDLETSRMRRPWPVLGRRATVKEIIYNVKGVYDRLTDCTCWCYPPHRRSIYCQCLIDGVNSKTASICTYFLLQEIYTWFSTEFYENNFICKFWVLVWWISIQNTSLLPLQAP